MARAYPNQDMSDLAHEPQAGEWQALRGELVALLDQVEGRYARDVRPGQEMSGLSRRVRNLREQVVGPEPSVRRREALRTVKRAVDRFSERDDLGLDDEHDALTSAIAEIRGRQGASGSMGRRATDMPELRDLSSLVGGLNGRLARLETELKSQRTSNGNVNEVAAQVEQLTHVVELLAGAVGETGQVKRLEAQISALASLVADGPKVDLSTINKRLDDVSATVGKLAELQAQQMEREIARHDTVQDPAKVLAPSMAAIEASVRNVYDRIDAIEKNVALSSTDFERLTSEMAAFTQALKSQEIAPQALMTKVDAIASRIGDFDNSNGDVAGLKQDISSLRDAVMAGMEPRFLRIESQIEALSDRIVAPADNSEVESQLRQLMDRMDEASSQLNGLSKLYATQSETPDFEAMATLVAERTSDALTRKAPAPVAMFGPDSLKSIEERIGGLIKSASRAPDFETLAALVAERTSEAVAKSAGQTPDYEALAALVAERTSAVVASAAPAPVMSSGVSEDSINALESRMTALLNTTGKDTSERLARLEAALTARKEAASPAPAAAFVAPPAKPAPSPAEDLSRVDAMLSALSSASAKSDAMPSNPGDDAPLVDPGFKDAKPIQSALDAKVGAREVPPAAARPAFDTASVERPPRPQSSFAKAEVDPFAPVAAAAKAPVVETPVSQNSTSTFVAAARRAQRARQEGNAPVAAAASNSLIGRALSRVMPAPAVVAEPAIDPEVAPVEVPAKPAKAEKPPKAEKPAKVKKVKPEPLPELEALDGALEDAVPQQSFLTRYRRPILLAATLAAVSMLALNLVMQRMGSSEAPAAPAENAVEAPAPAPAASTSEEVSLVLPEPRVIDMVDNTTTAAIGGNAARGFSKTEVPALPSTLVANTTAASTGDLVVPAASEAAPAEIAAAPQTFDLLAEGVGPLELRQAAADGDARAQFEIGAIFTEGRAVEQDYVEAAKWYERSAAQGFVPAQYRLGNLYEAGQGVEKNLELAKLWYQRGAEAGNRMAMHNLAALYAGGELGDQEFESAAEWFQQAAARGMTDSQFNLGMLYARGLGVEQDFEQSYKWFSLAARSGDADAGKARDDIAKSLSADAVSRVNAELGTWQAEPIDLATNFAPLGTWSPTFDPGQTITTKDVVSKVQVALGKLGFDVGTADGIAGRKTADAIKAFERGTGMPESGLVNPRLLAVLGSQPV